jgi:hypothetical protein
VKLFRDEPYNFLVNDNFRDRFLKIKPPEEIIVQIKRVVDIITKTEQD